MSLRMWKEHHQARATSHKLPEHFLDSSLVKLMIHQLFSIQGAPSKSRRSRTTFDHFSGSLKKSWKPVLLLICVTANLHRLPMGVRYGQSHPYAFFMYHPA